MRILPLPTFTEWLTAMADLLTMTATAVPPWLYVLALALSGAAVASRFGQAPPLTPADPVTPGRPTRHPNP